MQRLTVEESRIIQSDTNTATNIIGLRKHTITSQHQIPELEVKHSGASFFESNIGKGKARADAPAVGNL